MKIDIITWVKNGEKVLSQTLTQIDKVIPEEVINKKIAVDDKSFDNTVQILKDHNWEVYPNPSTGISAGANFAFSKVEMEHTMTHEQDLLLCPEWWNIISKNLEKENVVASSGVRIPNQPRCMTKFEEYRRRNMNLNTYDGFRFGKYLDNTLWKTKFLKSVGGFPILSKGTGVDTVLSYLIKANGYDWVVEKEVVSTHLRLCGLREEVKHQYWYTSGLKEIHQMIEERTGIVLNENFKSLFIRTLFSPIRGFEIAIKMREPMITVVYPAYRLYSLCGYLGGN